MENPSSYQVNCSRRRAFDSSVLSTRPRSASTSWSASDQAFRSDSRAFRSISRVSRVLWSATLVSARDFYSATSVFAWRTFTALSSRSAAITRPTVSSFVARTSVTSITRS